MLQERFRRHSVQWHDLCSGCLFPILQMKIHSSIVLAGLLWSSASFGFDIVVDYTYDTQNFFNTQERRDALQAAADRYAAIITTPLLEVTASYNGGASDWRVGFTHPGTGASWQISTAPNAGSDALAGSGAADVYDSSFSLGANTWRLFAGGRSGLGSAGVGGTGTGLNFSTVFDDPNGPMHRGAIPNTPSDSVGDLPTWGGAIAFNSDTNWHFGIGTSAPSGQTDFYSIALHEIGHALGLSTDWNQWQSSGGVYTGSNAIAAYNADNGTSLIGLNEVSSSNEHWQDGAYESFIFAGGNPNLAGTQGLGIKQDLLMEPIANFIFPTQRRFELTNVDVAALEDIGWTVIPEPSAAVFLLFGLAGLLGRRRLR
jgi:hypothetical protein